MEPLKVLKVQEQAEACWKSFKERTLTKKTARENLLLNSDFNSLLLLLIGDEGNERAVKVAIDFLAKCIKAELISPIALLTLIQQKLPAVNASKIISLPILNRVSELIIELERLTGIDFAFQLASGDLRVVPFLVEKTLSLAEFDINSDFINFLLGDPDLVLTSSVFDNLQYKFSRCRVLSHLAENIQRDDYSELLTTFFIWNSGRLCAMELGFLVQISRFFAGRHEFSEAHLELFEVFIEIMCNEYFKFGNFSETIEFICLNCRGLINEYSAFRLGSLLLLRDGVDSDVANAILQILLQYGTLSSFSKVCCSAIMMKCNVKDDLEVSMKNIFKLPINYEFSSTQILNEPFTEFGMLTALAFKSSRPKSTTHEKYFDLVELSKGLSELSSIDIRKYLQKGHFEAVFSLLAYEWTLSAGEEVVKGFLMLLGDVENEESEAKILRYSWVVDFFETHFTDEIYLNYLPLICEFVTNTDNILFAFVQQKISLLLSQKGNVSVQVPVLLSLFNLFESSQTRQSRLNFLASINLSYLHNIIAQILDEIDTRAVVLGFKLLGKLAEIAVVDPRDIWSKYVEKILSNDSLSSNSLIRVSMFSFASSLRIIPDGPEGELNEIKIKGISILLENLGFEMEQFVLDQICSSLVKFNVDTLRKVEVARLQPEPIIDEEGNVKEVPIEDILINSVLFNPVKLYEISLRYDERPSRRYDLLWAKLIDNEVEVMPRIKFLGSTGKASNVSKESVKYLSNPSFCNGLIFETFDDNDFASTANVLKCIKSRLMPLIPSIITLLWYVRPHFPDFLFDAISKIGIKIDDRRIRTEMSNYEFLLSNLKSGNTPQSASNLLMTISAVMKTLFMNQNISENFLFSNWASVLAGKLSEITDFKPLLGNEEFLGALAISCSILSGCSSNIDSVLCSILNSMIINNPKIKDGVAVYCAIEAMSKLDSEIVKKILVDKSSSSKRKLIAGIALLRTGVEFDRNLSISDKPDDLALMLEIIVNQGTGNFGKTAFVDPLEFKGLASYVQSLLNPEELKEKSKQRAFDSGSVPALLKYDAILAYLLGSGLNLATLTFNSSSDNELKSIESSTKDSKCLALLQLVSRSSSAENEVEFSGCGLERYDKFSWLKFIGSIKSKLRFDILAECKLLPRITWPSAGIENFDFVLKHVLSITPITKVPYINPSLLSAFLENVLEVVKRGTISSESDLKRIVEILYNNSDEASSKVLCELLNHAISDRKIFLLRIILEESVKYPQNLLKTFDNCRFNDLEPEIISEISELLNYFVMHFSFDSSKLAVIDIDGGKNVFISLKNILNTREADDSGLKLKVLGVKIKELGGRGKIKAAIDVIDLMFICQQDEDKFLTLNKLLCDIFENMALILTDSESSFDDAEIVNKIRSRASVIPKDICDRLETCFIASEFNKKSF